MDCNQGLTNSSEYLLPMVGKSFAYAPSSSPESLYNMRSGPNSLFNLPCCISSQGSSSSNFSPGRHTADVTRSQSLQSHPCQTPPAVDPYAGNVHFRRYATRYFYAGGKKVNKKRLNPQLNFQRNIKMHPTTGKEIYDVITTAKSNTRRKKDIKLSENKYIYKRYFPSQSIDNKLQSNYYDPNIVPNHVSNKVKLENVSAQSIDNNLQTNYYDRNIFPNHVPNRDKLENVSAESIDSNLQINYYDPNIVPNHVSYRVKLENVSAQSIDNNLQTNCYDPSIVPNHVSNRVKLENVSTQSIDYNLQINYDPNVVLSNVPNEATVKNIISSQSIINNPQTNYNPNVLSNNVPNTVMSQGCFSAQSINFKSSTNYYDPNIVSYYLPSNIMPKGKFSTQCTDNYLQTNYNPIIDRNDTTVHTEVSASNKDPNQCSQHCSTATEQNHTDEKHYSHVQVAEDNIDEKKISAVNSTVTEQTNFMTSGDKDTKFNTQSQNDLLQKVFASTVQPDTDVSDIQTMNSLNLSDYNVTHVTMPENSYFSIQDIHQEKLGNADLSSYSFEPIFEGKDENGENIVVLLVN